MSLIGKMLFTSCILSLYCIYLKDFQCYSKLSTVLFKKKQFKQYCEFNRKTIVFHRLYFVPILHSYYSAYLNDLKSAVSDDPHIIKNVFVLS